MRRETAQAKAYLRTFHGKAGEKKAPIRIAESASGVSAAGSGDTSDEVVAKAA